MAKTKQYRIPVPIIPEELIGVTEECLHCQHWSEIPWLNELTYPKQAVEPDDGNGKGYWVPVSFDFPCKNCKSIIRVNVPVKKTLSVWTVYGDESERRIDNKFFFCITLIALHNKRHKNIARQISKLKKSIRPNIEPDAWQLHFTEILNDGKRGAKSSLFLR
ncbi:MAG: hypothetical protein JKY45_09585 [Emcibacter sp.]|nr:hypothetical protein [Emcibacter sp.]